MKETAHIEILFKEQYLVTHLQEFQLIQKVNDHVRLHFKGITSAEIATKCMEAKAEEALIQVYQLDTQPKSLIFQGLLTTIRKNVKNSVFEIEAEALSATCRLDIKRRNRSFQDKEMLFKDLFKLVLGSEEAFTLVSGYETEKIKNFYLQYEETDWEFLIRMASRLNTVVVADPIAAKPKVTIGMPQIKGTARPNQLNYHVEKDFAVQRVLTENNYLTKSITGLNYYHIEEPHEILEIGFPITFNNETMKVLESKAVLSGSTIVNQCIITTPEGFKQAPKYNNELVGLTVDATMQAVSKTKSRDQSGNPVDRVKIKFNFENETFDETKAWPFPYATYYGAEGSAGWYCMPEIGDRLKVYFPSRDESQAFVTTSLRQKDTDRMKDPNVKYYRNSHGKSIVLSKDEIVIIGKDDNQGKVLIRLNESNGVLIYSDLSTEVSTSNGGDINLAAGRDIKVVAQNKVVLKNDKTSIYIDGNGQVCTHIKGKVNSTRVPVLIGPVKPKKSLKQPEPIPNSGPQPTPSPTQETKKKDDKNKHCHRHDEFLKELEQFPEDYRPALEKLHNLHTEWRFEAYKTGVDFEKFVNAEAKPEVNVTNVENLIKKPKSKLRDKGGYYDASRESVKYYLDPRNFLTESQIYQFLSGKYNKATQTIEAVNNVLGNCKLKGKGDVFIKAGKTNASAVFLAAKSMVETGGGASRLAQGIVIGYEGWYNTYGIGASDGVSSDKSGANYAKSKGWDSIDKAIIGGGAWIYERYLSKGQDTLYTLKWNIEYYKTNKTTGKQYATNIRDAYNKADRFAKGLKKCNAPLTFRIPVFNNMK